MADNDNDLPSMPQNSYSIIITSVFKFFKKWSRKITHITIVRLRYIQPYPSTLFPLTNNCLTWQGLKNASLCLLTLETEKHRANSHLLKFSFPNVLCWVQNEEPGIDSVQVSHMGPKNATTWTIGAAHQSEQQGAGVRSLCWTWNPVLLRRMCASQPPG